MLGFCVWEGVSDETGHGVGLVLKWLLVHRIRTGPVFKISWLYMRRHRRRRAGVFGEVSKNDIFPAPSESGFYTREEILKCLLPLWWGG